MLSYKLHDASLIRGETLQDEGKAHFLVIILEREERWLVLKLYVIVLKGVYLNAHEVKLIHYLLTPEHACFDVVNWYNESDSWYIRYLW